MDGFCTATDGFAVPSRAARNRQRTSRFKRRGPSPRSAAESNSVAKPCGPAGPAGAKRLDRVNVRGHELSAGPPWLRRPPQRNGSHDPYDVALGRPVAICVALLSPVQERDQEHTQRHGPGKQIELEDRRCGSGFCQRSWPSLVEPIPPSSAWFSLVIKVIRWMVA
jgi:hypothetical protein